MNIPGNDFQNSTSLRLVLRQLITCVGLTANALAKIVNLPTPTINRLLTGEVQDPRSSTLIIIADFFGITLDQLLGRETLPEKFRKKDSPLSNARPPNSIPILSMTEAVNPSPFYHQMTSWLRWQSDNKYHVTGEDIQPFAVSIKNDLYEPIFRAGSFIIVNPVIEANSGDFVLVKFHSDQAAIIKKYVAEGEYRCFYSLKPEVGTIIFDASKCAILGVVVESYMNFRE